MAGSAEMSKYWVYRSVDLWERPSVIHILIGINPHSYLFVSINPLTYCDDAIFVRWVDCNTPFPEYILRYVFWFFDHIFWFSFCIYFCFMIICAFILNWIRIRGLRINPSLNRGPDPNILLDLAFTVADLTDFSFKHCFLIFFIIIWKFSKLFCKIFKTDVNWCRWPIPWFLFFKCN